MNKLIIVGASGHGKVVADIAKKNGYTDIAFLDDNENCRLCGQYSVIGKCKDALRYRDADFIVAIGNSEIRCKIQAYLLEMHLHVISLVHPQAIIAEHVEIGLGSVVMAGAVINPYVTVGQGCIVNTCASVDHDCVIGNYAHVSVGAHVAGTVEIGDHTWIGVGAIIRNNTKITNNCMIGAGAVVIQDIKETGTYMGVPARRKQ